MSRTKKPWSRRRFLQSTGVAASTAGLGVMVPGRLQAENRPGEDETGEYDVIVVGSGFAGVTAARNSSQGGLKVLHLEASARMGGRTFTSRFADHDIDLGGTWIGWGQPHIWAEKMRYNEPVAESAAYGASHYVWFDENGRRKEGSPDDFWKIMGPANEAFYEPARSALPRPYRPLFVDGNEALDETNAAEAIEALAVTPEQKSLLLSFAAINCHNSADQSSYLDQMRWIALSGFSQSFLWDNIARFRFKGGTKSLLAKMHQDSRAVFKRGQPVTGVEQKNGKVYVTTARNQTFVGSKLILAVPLNVLHKIDFTPAISGTKLDISRQGHTGSGVKVYVRVKGKGPLVSCQGTQTMPLNFLWTEYDDEDSQVLVGFGASPTRLDTADTDAVTAAVRQYLPNAEVLETMSYNWNADPFALGTWCMFRPGWLTGALEELQRPEGNIHFANGDIADGWRGFIDGAVESGARTAAVVTQALKAEGTVL